MIVIPRKYFSDKVIDAKLEESYGKIKEIMDFFDGYKFNRENLSKLLFDIEGDETKLATKREAEATVEAKLFEGKQTVEQIPYWLGKIDKWEAIKASQDDVVIDDIEELEKIAWTN